MKALNQERVGYVWVTERSVWLEIAGHERSLTCDEVGKMDSDQVVQGPGVYIKKLNFVPGEIESH